MIIDANKEHRARLSGGIGRRFSYSLIGVVTIILAAFAVIGILLNIARMERQLETRLNNAIKLAEISLPTPLWNLDTQVARNFVEALFLDDSVVHATLIWGDGDKTQKSLPGFEWIEKSVPKAAAAKAGDDVISGSADIVYEQSKVGRIFIVMSRHKPREQITFQIYGIIALTVLIIAAIWLTSLVVSRRHISTPLSKLQDSASQIAHGNLDANVDKSGSGEIGTLANNLDMMRESIKHLFAELNRSKLKLEEYSQTLERMVEERTKDLAKSVEELRALGEVSQVVNSTLDLKTVLTRIVHQAVQLSNADAASIYEIDESGQLFLPRINYGVSDEFIKAMRESSLRVGDKTVIGQAAELRAPKQIADLHQVIDYPIEYMKQTDFRALLAIPLMHRDVLLGGLVVRRRKAGEFPAPVVELLQTFATHSALAIRNALLFGEIEEKGRDLELANRHKSEFLANMSHELRTPMNAILGYTELILDEIYGEVPEKIRDVLGRLEQNGRHLLSLINDVLDISKMEAGKLILSLNEYSMGSVVHTVKTSLEPLAAEKGLALKADVKQDLPMGLGDEQRISQVLLNLAGNAIKFTDSGEIRIEAGLDGNGFLVSVLDTGPGLSESEQGNIFKKFHQADSSMTKQKGGTGLGLSIAKKIVQMHGGELWVESKLGKGSAFRFRIPVQTKKTEV